MPPKSHPPSKSFSPAEKAAMKERAKELKAEARASKNKSEGELAVLKALAKLPPADRSLGERLHTLITANAPALWPRLWYGMPAYASPPPPAGTGKVVCFFQAAAKFKTRYATFAFTDNSTLDQSAGPLWPTAYGVKSLTPTEESKLATLIKKAVN